MSLAKHIANSTGRLSPLLEEINTAFSKAVKDTKKLLDASEVDFIFVEAPDLAIPELGVGGYSPGAHVSYIYLDPENKKLDSDEIYKTLLHETHHCMRWRGPGYGKTLREALISEGLATLFEEEVTGDKPIYACVEIDYETVKKTKKILDSTEYEHSNWFFGSGSIPRWFGYSYGYEICKSFSEKTNSTASSLAFVDASRFIL